MTSVLTSCSSFFVLWEKAWNALHQVSRLRKNQVHTMLVFAEMNLKKLVTWQWEHMSSYFLLYKNRQKYQSTLLVKRKLILLPTV
ncbi:predicted protein [Enterococcus faecium Com15]|nr:predicted protein [Enterococcus faecium Com15]